MNKTIFQIGLLAFCVSAVMFGTKSYALLDIISRSFIVFVAVVIGIAVLLAVSTTFVDRQKEPHHESKTTPAKSTGATAQAAKQ